MRMLFLAGWGMALATAAGARTLCVATNGSNLNDGSAGRPFQTIQWAVNQAATGDTIVIAGGVYREQVTIANKGATNAPPLTIRAATGESPVIDGDGLFANQWLSLVDMKNCTNVALQGVGIRNSYGYNLRVVDSRFVELTGLEISGARNNSGVYMYDALGTNCPAFVSVRQCVSHHNYRNGIAVYYTSGGYYLLENNVVYSNQLFGNYDGIQVGSGSGGAHHVAVRNNLVYDNGNAVDGSRDQIDVGGHGNCHNLLVEGNDVFLSNQDGPRGSFKFHGSLKGTTGTVSPHSQIARFNRLTHVVIDQYETPCPAVWYHNTWVGRWMAVYFGVDPTLAVYPREADGGYSYGDGTFAGGDTGRQNFKNNIFYQMTDPGSSANHYLIQFDNGTNGSPSLKYSSLRLQNNLYRFGPLGAMIWRSNDSVGWNTYGQVILLYARLMPADFTRYQAGNSPYFQDTGSLWTNLAPGALFADVTNRDYRLCAGCPAIDRGIPLTQAIAAGVQTNVIRVDRATYFQDGYYAAGRTLLQPDLIKIGTNQPVSISPGGVDHIRNEIRLDQSLTWKVNDPVTLPYQGGAPDLGASEWQVVSTGTRTPAPARNIRVSGSTNPAP